MYSHRGNAMYFNSDQTARLNDLIKNVEQRTGIELVTAVVGKCDSYPEIPWKAFALAAALSGLAMLIQTIVRPGWTAGMSVPPSLFVIFGAGAAASLLSVFWPAFGRLFLDRRRAEAEITQYAKAFFLERELFRTRSRTGILILVSLFERRVVILPDSGAAGRIGQKALQAIIDEMTPHLRRKDRFEALARALSAIERELIRGGAGTLPKTGNELADEIIQQKGEDR